MLGRAGGQGQGDRAQQNLGAAPGPLPQAGAGWGAAARAGQLQPRGQREAREGPGQEPACCQGPGWERRPWHHGRGDSTSGCINATLMPHHLRPSTARVSPLGCQSRVAHEAREVGAATARCQAGASRRKKLHCPWDTLHLPLPHSCARGRGWRTARAHPSLPPIAASAGTPRTRGSSQPGCQAQDGEPSCGAGDWHHHQALASPSTASRARGRAKAPTAGRGWQRNAGQGGVGGGVGDTTTRHRIGVEVPRSSGCGGQRDRGYACARHPRPGANAASGTGRPPAQTPPAQPLCGRRGVGRSGGKTGCPIPSPSPQSGVSPGEGAGRRPPPRQRSPQRSDARGGVWPGRRSTAASRTPTRSFWPFWHPTPDKPLPRSPVKQRHRREGGGRRGGRTLLPRTASPSHQDPSAAGNSPALTSLLDTSRLVKRVGAGGAPSPRLASGTTCRARGPASACPQTRPGGGGAPGD